MEDRNKENGEMSFSLQVKRALCGLEPPAACCAKAELYGMLLFCQQFSALSVRLQTGSDAVAAHVEQALRAQTGVQLERRSTPHRREGAFTHVLRTATRADARSVLAYFGHAPSEVSLRLNLANLENECCIWPFLRGVFLSCGMVTSPQKNYRLELIVARRFLADALAKLLSDTGLPPLETVRGNSIVLYYKDSSAIEDFLTAVGAIAPALELMNVKVYKDLRNRVNRISNCETANLTKTVRASSEQVEAISYLSAHGGLRQLPPELREVARLRLRHPEASLSEIGQMLSAPLSRSGVNHRLKKLQELAAEARQAREKDAGELHGPAEKRKR